MAKKQGIPETLPELRESLVKLKDREARLEADLAIRDEPKLEQPIASIVLAMVDVKKAELALRIMNKPKGEQANKIALYEKKVLWHKTQVEIFKDLVLQLKVEHAGPVDSMKRVKIAAYSTKEAWHTKKAMMLEDLIKRLLGPEGKKMTGLYKKKIEKIQDLRDQYAKWEPMIKEAGVDMLILVPSLEDYLEET